MLTLKQYRTGLANNVIRNADELHKWIQLVLGLSIPTHPLCPHHDAPFTYLKHTFFEPASDLVVWAPRGGGKTRLGAIATLLDLVFKPHCQVRILGGSLEQSLKMWEHLHPDILKLIDEGHVKAKTSRNNRVTLSTGSSAAVLTQSERAVRGLRVQKLRCDEVELFDTKVWSAAQLTTRSLPGTARNLDPKSEISNPQSAIRNPQSLPIAATIEALSTLHSRFGLMHDILESARANNTRVIKWCLLDVLENCPPSRDCKTCPLYEDCRGLAKNANGFMKIDDAIAMKKRVSQETWDAEMMCRRPSVKDSVFRTFDESIHVRESVESHQPFTTRTWLAMDFGYVAPFVCLFIRTAADKSTHVFDEYVQDQRMLEEHLVEVRRRFNGEVYRVACDPAGKQRNDQTSHSNVQLLRKQFTVRCRSSQIVDGVEKIRRALKPAHGGPSLFIHPRCTRLIRALLSYRYEGQSEVPMKDGVHDHLIDALRYYFVNREEYPVTERRY